MKDDDVLERTTKHGVVVRVGQRWRNCDYRSNGTVKTVLAVDNEYATLYVPGSSQRSSRVLIRRMYKHSTGWELVS